ncbi:hypothetical protein [Acinetobacter ursingii]|uniref:hypothetical protein n=2 Tax=Acinetobacter ursingii TaxID=108980 RepID=UPI001250920B|nr:hypothetical protein [Acinetobacter ursingii]
MKIDVAVQSFKKPELLLYTLLSLKKFEKNQIDQVWIQDDSSDDTVAFYESGEFKKALYPWKINVKKNNQRSGWWFTPVKGLYPKYLSMYKRILFSLRSKYRGTGFQLLRENSRYQYGIDNTEKKFLLIIHDDIVFYKPFLSEILDEFMNNDKLAIVGDLGQCWRCDYKNKGCTPQKIVQGYRPSKFWPDKNPDAIGHRWPCRVNEWCSIIRIEAAKSVEKKYNVLFGNYDNHGDVAAYWFNLVNQSGYHFNDLACTSEEKSKIFLHADGGSGHSVWVDQGDGKKVYDPEHIRNEIKKDFNVEV